MHAACGTGRRPAIGRGRSICRPTAHVGVAAGEEDVRGRLHRMHPRTSAEYPRLYVAANSSRCPPNSACIRSIFPCRPSIFSLISRRNSSRRCRWEITIAIRITPPVPMTVHASGVITMIIPSTKSARYCSSAERIPAAWTPAPRRRPAIQVQAGMPMHLLQRLGERHRPRSSRPDASTAASPPPGRGRRGAGPSLVMTAPGRSVAHPAAP